MSLVHSLVTMPLVTHCMQTFAYIFHCNIREGSCVSFATLEDHDLTQETLDELGDSHARRNRVRVYDDVWHYTLGGERHILLPVSHSNGTLLSVSGCLYNGSIRIRAASGFV